jgi:hypothetical protein
MKTKIFVSLTLVTASVISAYGQAGAVYTNFIRQVQLPTNVRMDSTVLPDGELGQLSALSINPGGARFELWTVKTNPLTVYLLDTRYVGTYVPQADVIITTDDPTIYNGVPRTRADRGFIVDVVTKGLRSESDAPVASKSVKLLRHVQSYGEVGDGVILDRTQATLTSQVSLVNNAIHRLDYATNLIPGANRSKIRGEERFSVYSLEDYQSASSQIASRYVQVWPVSDGSISGLAANQVIRFSAPTVTFAYRDLYPDSRTYAQVYKGEARSGVQGAVVPGSWQPVFQGVPYAAISLTSQNYDSLLNSDGRWTMELVTETPFGIERMRTPSGAIAAVTFNVDRTIEVNSTVTTVE